MLIPNSADSGLLLFEQFDLDLHCLPRQAAQIRFVRALDKREYLVILKVIFC